MKRFLGCFVATLGLTTALSLAGAALGVMADGSFSVLAVLLVPVVAVPSALIAAMLNQEVERE